MRALFINFARRGAPAGDKAGAPPPPLWNFSEETFPAEARVEGGAKWNIWFIKARARRGESFPFKGDVSTAREINAQ